MIHLADILSQIPNLEYLGLHIFRNKLGDNANNLK